MAISNKKMQCRKVCRILRFHIYGNIDFQKNIPSFTFSISIKINNFLKDICPDSGDNYLNQVTWIPLMVTDKRLSLIKLLLTGHIKTKTTKALMVNIKMMKQVNQYIVRIHRQLKGVRKFKSQRQHQQII